MKIKFLKVHPDAQLPKRNHDNMVLPTAAQQEELDDFKIKLRFSGQPLPPGGVVDFRRDDNNAIMGTGDTGYDIFAVEDKFIPEKCSAVVETGIKVAYISPGYWFRVEARGGLSFKFGIIPHFGVVDNGYTGSLGVKLYNHSNDSYFVKKGDKIAQLVVYQIIEPEISWAEEAHETLRGEKGFGSSDEK